MQKILVVNNAEPGITQFTKPIETIISNARLTYVTIEYNECLNYKFGDFQAIILSGSPQGDDIVENHLPYFKWIKNSNKPILGICAGHHITGVLYGSKILRSEEPEAGDYEVEIIEKDIIFSEMDSTFKVKQMHNDSITLPEDFTLLSTSKTCKNQIMKHKQKSLYTCQFHPEFYNPDLILNFITLCK